MPETPETPAPQQKPEGLTAPLNIPDIPGLAPSMPQDLNWENISDIWQAIEHARQTKDPAEWNEVTAAVGDSLRSWRKKETQSADNLQMYNLMRRHALLKPEGSEERQKILDRLQKLKETFPPAVQRAIERDDQRISSEKGVRSTLQQRADVMKPGEQQVSGRWVEPGKAELQSQVKKMEQPRAKVPLPRVAMIDSLIRQLEGIRQADFESYHPDVKNRIKKFGTDAEEAQDVLQRQLKIQHERLEGIKDPKRRAPLEHRLNELNNRYQNTQDEVESKRLEGEMDALIRRLEGAKTEAGRAKIAGNIENIKAQMKTPEELRLAQREYSNNLKYDALLWLVTTVAHPIKARPAHVPGASRGPSQAASPVGKMPYVPPKPGELWQVPRIPESPKKTPKTLLGRAKAEEDPMSYRPYKKGGASECHIFLSMIHEGKFEHAKAFIETPFIMEEGSLVVLENITDMPELNGLKGRVRKFSEESGRPVVVDLFKNDVIADPAIKVAFYEARPYLL